MSYSFSIAEATKEAAKARVTAAMAGVMSTQAPHCQEGPAVIAAAHAFIDAMTDTANGYNVSLNGTVSVENWSDPATPLMHASVTITVARA